MRPTRKFGLVLLVCHLHLSSFVCANTPNDTSTIELDSPLGTATTTELTSSSILDGSPTSSIPHSLSTPIPSTSAGSDSITSRSVSTDSLSFTTSTSTTSPLSPTSSAALTDIDIIRERRSSSIVGSLSGRGGTISAWLTSLGGNGKWPDSEVDYTTGCDARRANWPAQEHWQRIVIMSAAWHGGFEGTEQFVKSNKVRAAISLAMDYWFSRDFTNASCLFSGGTSSCPCTNVGNLLWNTNWFSNVILIPRLVGQSCVLLDDTLTPTQAVNCARITRRSYDVFVNRVGYLTGANTLDVASIGINLALLTTDTTILADAYTRIHSELVIRNEVKADGIRADGSFGQHSGVLYNGNYGKDYVNTILDIEREAGGTKYAANAVSQNAFAALFDGDRWMIYGNSLANVLHWDFSALGRFISFPVVDNQATGSIKINLTEVRELGQQWSSSSLLNFADTLSQSFTNANAGGLTGNRMFYNNDYMVHRGSNYVSTVKMFSSRTLNTECVNLQNPLGFHLSDGTLYTYLRGDEYEDISAAWDWNLIPGTTIDYKATALSCDQALVTGVERFVGGVSDGKIGLAAMRYTNPSTKAFRWQKVWFFLNDDVQHVMIANISSTTTSPVYSVLDQRRLSGSPVTGEATVGTTKVQTLWHGNVGYILPPNNVTKLSVQTGSKTGDWATIGTSEQPPTTVNLFAAWVQHTSLATPISYTAFPGTDSTTFSTKVQQLRLQAVRNDARGSAVFDEVNNTTMIVFWDGSAGSITFTPPGLGAITISSNGNVAIIYKLNTGQVVAADPSQTLSTVQVTISIPTGKKPPVWSSSSSTKILTFSLPQGGTAGNGVTLTV